MRVGADCGGLAGADRGLITKASGLTGVLKGFEAGCWLKGWKTKNLLGLGVAGGAGAACGTGEGAGAGTALGARVGLGTMTTGAGEALLGASAGTGAFGATFTWEMSLGTLRGWKVGWSWMVPAGRTARGLAVVP